MHVDKVLAGALPFTIQGYHFALIVVLNRDIFESVNGLSVRSKLLKTVQPGNVNNS